MVHQQTYVRLDVKTPWGDTDVAVPKALYEIVKRSDRGEKIMGADGKRVRLCIQIKEKLNSKGATIQWLEWHQVKVEKETDIGHTPVESDAVKRQPTARQKRDSQVAELAAHAQSDELDAEIERMLEQATKWFPDYFGLPVKKPQSYESRYPCGCTGSLPPVTTT